MTGAKLAFCMALSIAALASRDGLTLGVVTAIVALQIAAYRVPLSAVWRGLRMFAWQSAVIVVLYIIRFGPSAGAYDGLRVSWQIFMAFLPGVVFMSTTPHERITAVLGRIMPYRAAFVVYTSMKFMPLLVSEMRGIYDVQLLRGANIRPRDAVRPSNWPDFVNCMVVPSVVRAMTLAGEVALAARAREFGERESRTYWPGSQGRG